MRRPSWWEALSHLLRDYALEASMRGSCETVLQLQPFLPWQVARDHVVQAAKALHIDLDDLRPGGHTCNQFEILTFAGMALYQVDAGRKIYDIRCCKCKRRYEGRFVEGEIVPL